MTVISVPDEAAAGWFGEPPDGVEVVVWNGTGERPARAAEIEFFVGSYLIAPPPREVFAALPRLRVIQLLSAGVEPWLGVVPEGVVLCNGRGVHGAATAELAVAGMLASLRELPAYAAAQVAHEWRRRDSDGLDGRRVLVVGAGDIGRRVAAACRAFDAEVTLVARTARDGVRAMTELPALVREHDVLVLALPSTPETHGLVDAGLLAALPDGALLVNVARGSVVDTDALLERLRAGVLSAFLDVVDPEPLPADHPLWDAPNLILTPHVGGGTRGWSARGYRLVRAQVRRFVAGEPLENRVEAGY